jgi:hypothetical protein
VAVRAGGGICELLARRFQPVSGADVGENAMAKAEDDKRVGATNNASARAGVKTRAAGAMAESNEGEVAEAPKYDSAEVRDETLRGFWSEVQRSKRTGFARLCQVL